jgi:hypothetical protein
MSYLQRQCAIESALCTSVILVTSCPKLVGVSCRQVCWWCDLIPIANEPLTGSEGQRAISCPLSAPVLHPRASYGSLHWHVWGSLSQQVVRICSAGIHCSKFPVDNGAITNTDVRMSGMIDGRSSTPILHCLIRTSTAGDVYKQAMCAMRAAAY